MRWRMDGLKDSFTPDSPDSAPDTLTDLRQAGLSLWAKRVKLAARPPIPLVLSAPELRISYLMLCLNSAMEGGCSYSLRRGKEKEARL